MNYLGPIWLSFLDKVIPKDAPNIQLKETKRAFYAGASAMFGLVTDMPENDPDDSLGELKLINIHNELRDYAKRLERGEE